jgi:NADP-dependent 3-hydroxy acid dehydrogenase YdfG
MVLLVTGCRSGIGLAVAREGVRRGHVVYGGVRAAGADALRRDGVRPLALDVTDAQQRDAAVATILAEEGRIDALVNNAGVALGGFLEQVDEDELQIISVSVAAAPTARPLGAAAQKADPCFVGVEAQ